MILHTSLARAGLLNFQYIDGGTTVLRFLNFPNHYLHNFFIVKIELGTMKKVNYLNTLRGILNFAIYFLNFSCKST